MAQQKTRWTGIVSAAIDFGTMYSSWAYSFQHSFEKDPTDVNSKNWNDGQYISEKAPTSILIRPDGKSLEAFGFDAENKYIYLIEEKKHNQYYFFKQFKMALYDQMSVSNELTIQDSLNRKLSALTVFSLAIEYLKNDLLSNVHKEVGGWLTDTDVKWVVTVPAIWTDSARIFMRKAAEKAGIIASNLELALEPEVASLYCQHLRIKQQGKENLLKLSPGTKYMVLDAGGGTIDTTVHQVTQIGALTEVYKASGNAWGGSVVNERFHSVIADAVGRELYEQFKIKHYDCFLDMERAFEVAKRKIDPDTDCRLRIQFPSCLSDMYREETGSKLDEQYNSKLSIKGDKVFFNPEASKELFKDPVAGVIQLVATLFAETKLKDTGIILMVGGFSECKMLHKAIINGFPDKTCIIPSEASLAVLKGAVIFGHDEKSITSRISKYTYGIDCRTKYDPEKHQQNRMFIQKDGNQKVDVFWVLVRVNEKVVPGEPCQSHVFKPSDDNTGFRLNLFASPREDVQYVDEPDCVEIGNVYVDCQDKDGRVGDANVSLMFGGTEIQVSAVNKLTGKTTNATFTNI